MKITIKTWASAAVLALGVLAAPSSAFAQTYPHKPVRLIVPFAPGGFTDVVARILGQKLSISMGQQFVIENRAGAGSIIGSDLVAKSAPDGYTLLMVSTTHVISPWIYKSVPYDPLKSFQPITKLVEAEQRVIAGASEMPIICTAFLLPVGFTDRTVHVQNQFPHRPLFPQPVNPHSR